MPKLIINLGGQERETALHDGDTLGRVGGNQIQLPVPAASRTHCRFTEESGVWWLTDLQSSNGTQVNGRRISKCELKDGDLIQVGAASLRFLMSAVEDEAPEVAWGEDDLSLLELPYLMLLKEAGGESRVVNLPEGRVTVGRKARHAIQIRDISVSGDHAELVHRGGMVVLKDLGSKNGTFVNGKRVAEARLSAGDEIRFGQVTARFGVGEPDLALLGGPQGEADQTGLEKLEGAVTLELRDLGGAREKLWNLVALLLILGLGVAAWLIFTEMGGASGGSGVSGKSPSGNLIPEKAWSFEPQEEFSAGEPLVWELAAGESSGEVETVEDPVRFGSNALAVRRSVDKGPPAVAFLSSPKQVSGGQAYRVSVSVWAPDSGTLPLVQLLWLEGLPKGDIWGARLAMDRIYGHGGRPGWHAQSGVVQAPSKARFVVLGVGVDHLGRAVFDGISMVPAAGLEPLTVSSFTPVLNAQGSLRLSHFGRVMLDRAGLVFREQGRSSDQDALLAAAQWSPQHVAGSLRGGLGDLAVDLKARGGHLLLIYRGQGLARAEAWRLPLMAPGGGGWQVTTLFRQAARLHEAPFQDVPTEAFMVGLGPAGHRDQIEVHFQDASGEPLALKTSLILEGGQPQITVALKGRERLSLDLQLSFQQEEAAARRLLVKARGLVARHRDGRAVKLLDEALARYPFVGNVQKDARRAREELMERGRQRLAHLSGRVDQALFFHLTRLVPGLLPEVKTAASRFLGTPLEPQFAALGKKLEGEFQELSKRSQDREAERMFARAQDYMKNGRKELALAFFRYVGAELKESAWADQAKQLAQSLALRHKQEGKH